MQAADSGKRKKAGPARTETGPVNQECISDEEETI